MKNNSDAEKKAVLSSKIFLSGNNIIDSIRKDFSSPIMAYILHRIAITYRYFQSNHLKKLL